MSDAIVRAMIVSARKQIQAVRVHRLQNGL